MQNNLIGLAILILDVYFIIEIVKGSMDTGKKILWILIILFLPVLGALLYYLLGRK